MGISPPFKGGLRLRKIFWQNFLAIPIRRIKWILLLWQGQRSHFWSQPNKMAGTVNFFRLSVGVSPWFGGGLGLRKILGITSWTVFRWPIKWIELLWRGRGIHFPSQTGRSVEIVNLLRLSMGVSPRFRVGLSSRKNYRRNISGNIQTTYYIYRVSLARQEKLFFKSEGKRHIADFIIVLGKETRGARMPPANKRSMMNGRSSPLMGLLSKAISRGTSFGGNISLKRVQVRER